VLRSVEEIVERSQAAAEFKAAVRELNKGQRHERIHFSSWLPKVKVLRVAVKFLDVYPQLPVERIEVEGYSGCSSFTGTATVFCPEPWRLKFNWDCAWRAQKEEMYLPDGGADQERAAREFGYECFREFSVSSAAGQQDRAGG